MRGARNIKRFMIVQVYSSGRGSYHYQVGFLWCLSNLSQVVLLVDKKHKIQTKLAIYTCEVLAWNMLNFHIFVELSSITKNGEIERPLFGFGN